MNEAIALKMLEVLERIEAKLDKALSRPPKPYTAAERAKAYRERRAGVTERDEITLPSEENVTERDVTDPPSSSSPSSFSLSPTPPISLSSTPSSSPTLSTQIATIAAHYRATFRKNAAWVLDGKRRRKILDRLKEGYTAEQLCRAIDGCASSPHHMGQNDTGTVYNEWSLIFRDAAHVDQFLGYADKHKPAILLKQPEKRVEATASLLAKLKGAGDGLSPVANPPSPEAT